MPRQCRVTGASKQIVPRQCRVTAASNLVHAASNFIHAATSTVTPMPRHCRVTPTTCCVNPHPARQYFNCQCNLNLNTPHIPTAPVTHRTGVTAHSASNAGSLPRLLRHHSQELFDHRTGTKSMPRRRTRSASPSRARTNQRHGPESNSLRPKSGTSDQTMAHDLWDQWPDGDFERL
ncbi:hypothetical protein BDR05DRAFT_156021 [Suillus weaverae]|nr:hypothetical protein BDR05DRAFT_156021 [Suillus weaverae]